MRFVYAVQYSKIATDFARGSGQGDNTPHFSHFTDVISRFGGKGGLLRSGLGTGRAATFRGCIEENTQKLCQRC